MYPGPYLTTLGVGFKYRPRIDPKSYQIQQFRFFSFKPILYFFINLIRFAKSLPSSVRFLQYTGPGIRAHPALDQTKPADSRSHDIKILAFQFPCSLLIASLLIPFLHAPKKVRDGGSMLSLYVKCKFSNFCCEKMGGGGRFPWPPDASCLRTEI